MTVLNCSNRLRSNIHFFSTVGGSFPLTPPHHRNTIAHLVRIGSVGSALQGLTSASEEGPHKERAHGTYAGIDGSVYESVVRSEGKLAACGAGGLGKLPRLRASSALRTPTLNAPPSSAASARPLASAIAAAVTAPPTHHRRNPLSAFWCVGGLVFLRQFIRRWR